MELSIFRQSGISESIFSEAKSIAEGIVEFASQTEISTQITNANQPGRSSHDVQDVFIHFLTEYGFHSEKQDLFKDAPNQLLRPDYFKKIDANNGIILEVERGKVTINNMDLLDFWKCHLCSHANVLYLMVPLELRQNEKMSPRKEYATVKKRMSSFFLDGNETNVEALFLFGY